jgi:rRNA maturation endonuclease Nob1
MVLSAAVVLVIGTLLFTLFVRSQDVPEAPAVSPTAHLEERKAQIYENLRDLQFEFRLGKLSDADYQKTKIDLQRELAKVLAEIDAVQPVAVQPVRAKAAKAAAETVAKASDKCPHCGAKFPQPLKFCGECGKAMV